MEIEVIQEDDFKSSHSGNKGSWKPEYIVDVEKAISENKGKIISFRISEGLNFYVGNSKNKEKALNVLLRSFLDNPNQKVKITKAEDKIKVDLR